MCSHARQLVDPTNLILVSPLGWVEPAAPRSPTWWRWPARRGLRGRWGHGRSAPGLTASASSATPTAAPAQDQPTSRAGHPWPRVQATPARTSRHPATGSQQFVHSSLTLAGIAQPGPLLPGGILPLSSRRDVCVVSSSGQATTERVPPDSRRGFLWSDVVSSAFRFNAPLRS